MTAMMTFLLAEAHMRAYSLKRGMMGDDVWVGDESWNGPLPRMHERGVL